MWYALAGLKQVVQSRKYWCWSSFRLHPEQQGSHSISWEMNAQNADITPAFIPKPLTKLPLLPYRRTLSSYSGIAFQCLYFVLFIGRSPFCCCMKRVRELAQSICRGMRFSDTPPNMNVCNAVTPSSNPETFDTGGLLDRFLCP